jgi:hypothetical protein
LLGNRCRAALRDTPSAIAIRFQLRPRVRAAATRSATRASLAGGLAHQLVARYSMTIGWPTEHSLSGLPTK